LILYIVINNEKLNINKNHLQIFYICLSYIMHYYNYQVYDQAEQQFKRNRHPNNLGFGYDNEFKDVRIDKIDGRLLDNIVEYNKNLTPDEINGTNVNNILKYDNLMTLSEFDKMLISKQYEKLYGKTRDANIIQQEEYENNKFMNLSLNEIAYKFTNTMAELIDEIPKAYVQDNLNLEIFTKDDRLIYVGIFFILLGFFLYFINVSS